MGWNVLCIPQEMVNSLTFSFFFVTILDVYSDPVAFLLPPCIKYFCRGAFVQVDASQEKVASRILAGFCAGDGDPRGKSGMQTCKMPEWMVFPMESSCSVLTRVSAGSCCPSSSEQNRHTDPNDSERQSR